MVRQSRFESLIEAKVGLAIGFGLSWLINRYAMGPLFGVHMTGGQALGSVVLFSSASLARQYLVRRLFNAAPWRRRASGFHDKFFLLSPVRLGQFGFAITRGWCVLRPHVYRSTCGWSCAQILWFRFYWGWD